MRNYQMVPDTIFPSDNPQGIPVLDPGMICNLVDMPFQAWGSIGRTSKMKGTWHFFTEDYRFTALWKNPQAIVKTKCVSVVEPNFSITDQMPYPVALYRVYQKRWLARYWQSRGIRVIADLNVSVRYLAVNMLGIPDGWTSYATRGYNDRIDDLKKEYKAAIKKAGTDRIYFLVYGGGAAVKQFCFDNPRVVHIDDHRNVIKAQAT